MYAADHYKGPHSTYKRIPSSTRHSRATLSDQCSIRNDSSDLWNTIKAWYTFLVHIGACIGLVFGLIAIDVYKFKIGSGASVWEWPRERLYQSQVTALISLALVLIRLIYGGCSALLAWRIICILLEKRGITLGELTRLADLRIPVLPRRAGGSREDPGFWRASVGWSLWAAVAILLLWPPAVVASLASSSISWSVEAQGLFFTFEITHS